MIGYRWLARRSGGGQGAVMAAAVSGNLLVCLAALPLALPLQAGEPRDWLVLAYLGVFQLGFAYVLLSRAITEVRAIEASLVLLLEPVLSPIWAWLVHGETPGTRAVAGGLVILAATAWHTWREPPAITIAAPALEG
jgi:DME family drug/metabolite transporter